MIRCPLLFFQVTGEQVTGAARPCGIVDILLRVYLFYDFQDDGTKINYDNAL